MAIPVSFNPPKSTEPLRLHLGGWEAKPGWKILNIQARPGVDFIGNCMDLGQFATASVDDIYASHVYEHLGYQTDLWRALQEAARVLKPGGTLRIGVPDLDVLCKMITDRKLTIQERIHVMRMMFGGQTDAHDFHYVGFTFDILEAFLQKAGFQNIKRVISFGIFNDTTELLFLGQRISLNVEATR